MSDPGGTPGKGGAIYDTAGMPPFATAVGLSIQGFTGGPEGGFAPSGAVTLFGTQSAYTIRSTETSTVVTPIGEGTPAVAFEGQKLVFLDGTAVVDPTGAAGEASRLYLAAFGRIPDADGLAYWTARIAGGGVGLDGVSDAFIETQEFAAVHGSSDDARLLDDIYANIFQRRPDSGGQAYWTDRLDEGSNLGNIVLNLP